jgi:hypothetical protein
VKLSWNNPVCEACWIDGNSTWDGDKLLDVRVPISVIASEREIEQCALCGSPTIVGIYVRRDPATVGWPKYVTES